MTAGSRMSAGASLPNMAALSGEPNGEYAVTCTPFSSQNVSRRSWRQYG